MNSSLLTQSYIDLSIDQKNLDALVKKIYLNTCSLTQFSLRLTVRSDKV